MYVDKKRNRVLLRDGSSVLTPFEFSRRLMLGEEVSHLNAVESPESQAYDLIYHTKTSKKLEEIFVYPSDHTATDQQIENVIKRITSSDRYTDDMEERVEMELDYFLRTNNITFLERCINLVDNMKRDGVVWGVGRGSSCASVVMYLIELNDINPLQFDISFEELSKEQHFDE